MELTGSNYVLVTPARNEADYIGRTIESVIAQTVLPRQWVIVSDGSTDRTDEIVADYAKKHSFIELLRADGDKQANFGSKVMAFRAGYERLGQQPHDYVGNLDADVSFEPDYFKNLIRKFQDNSEMGLAGGNIHELIDGRFLPRKGYNLNSVAGAVQLFRRECYESIGGYIPLKRGGIDSAAEIMARIKGWKVRTFPDLVVRHHRRVLLGGGKILKAFYNFGYMNNLLGYHPLFQMALCVRNVVFRPYFVGALWMFAGYFIAAVNEKKKPVPDEFVRFLRAEQMRRMVCMGRQKEGKKVREPD